MTRHFTLLGTVLPVTTLFLLLAFLLGVNAPAALAQAGDTTITDCTEANLDRALNTAQTGSGGIITLDCPAGTTISFTSQKRINGDVTVNGADSVTLASNNRGRHFMVRRGGALQLANLTLTNGSAEDGGALYVEGTLTTENVIMHDNRARESGGAIYVDGGTVNLTATELSNNTAEEGGALYLDSRSTATLVDANISTNRAQYGGGVHVSFRSAVTIDGSQIVDNGGTRFGEGGGVYADYRSTATITNSNISGNSARYGGGISVEERAVVTVDGSSISGNSAREGGGVYVDEATLALGNVTISGNTADGLAGGIGGGLYVSEGRATLTHVTMAGNTGGSARQAAGIYTDDRSSIALYNSVLDNPLGVNCVFDRRTEVSERAGSFATDRSCGGEDVGVTVAESALLSPLGDNGGGTLTHLPALDSPLLDAGDAVFGLASDQRGMERPHGAGFDIGAVERQEND